MDGLKHLIDNRWILMDRDSNKYFSVKEDLPAMNPLIREKLGLNLILTHSFIKLEKTADLPKTWMGIQSFKNKLEYVLLCLTLAFLENYEEGDKFTLSQLTEFLKGVYTYDTLDWTVYRTRLSIVNVLKFLSEEGIVNVTDLSGSGFAEDIETEVLYENTGISKYFMKNLNIDIDNIGDFGDSDSAIPDEYRGVARRQRVYRKLLLEPVVYRRDNEEDFLYIKNRYQTLEKDFNEFFNCRIMVHKSMAYLLLDEDVYMGQLFPDTSNKSEIALLICSEVRRRVDDMELAPDEEDYIKINKIAFHNLLAGVQASSAAGLTKQMRELSAKQFSEQMTDYLFSIDFITEGDTDYEYTLKPIMGRLAGAFPENFIRGEGDEPMADQ